MKTVVILGAGASRGYSLSRTGVHPPLATNFFSTFAKLMISRDLEVKIGDIVNYIRDTRGIPPSQQPTDFDENIEVVFAELDRRLRSSWDLVDTEEDSKQFSERVTLSRAYDQFIFWFSHVLNEIQNGRPCSIYAKLLFELEPNDTILSFNWDTILDRVLYEQAGWFPDDGYGVQFDGFLHNGWREPRQTSSRRKLLKLHGSTNWFGPYVTRNFQTGERQWLANEDTVNRHWALVAGETHFETYKDRWRPGYQPFSYFFPPNDPITNKPLMPILIPPTDAKLFTEYSSIFNQVWSDAHSALRESDRLLVIGYSFPPTDTHAYSLLESFVAHQEGKLIEIVDPFGDGVLERVRSFVGHKARVVLHKATLGEYLGVPVVKLDDSHSETARYDAELESQPLERPDGSDLEEDIAFETVRKDYIVGVLCHLNLSRQPFDLTTYDGKRYLDATVLGEFATHLEGGYREEVLSYRLSNIKIGLRDGTELTIDLKNIWIVNPVPVAGISNETLAAVDTSIASPDLREMIRESFHCKSDEELDHFLRRYLAS